MNAYQTAVRTIIATAQDYVRRQVPYVWGGTTPNGVDCSGLTVLCYRAAGLTLPRFSGDQYQASNDVTAEQARPGDLVFFFGTDTSLGVNVASHVGIYIGNGQMINAASESTTVRQEAITGYWLDHRPTYSRPAVLSALDHDAPSATTMTRGTIARVNAEDGLNLRVAPSRNAYIIQTLPDQTYVLVLGGPIQANNLDWYRIDGPDAIGWAAGKYLDPIQVLHWPIPGG